MIPNAPPEGITFRPVAPDDISTLEEIAVLAWTPVFASFRRLMGDAIFATVCANWQEKQRSDVAAACRGDNGARVMVAGADGRPVGFAAYYVKPEIRVGELSLNAVHPDYQNLGIATYLYRLILDQLRDAGMDVVEVSTGGDPSHAPARRAYEKAGFTHTVPSVAYFIDLRRSGTNDANS